MDKDKYIEELEAFIEKVIPVLEGSIEYSEAEAIEAKKIIADARMRKFG